jgi:drug/metabolite transporter (DMT)-like permease
MTGFAFVLIIAAAFMHASWNFLAKRTGNSGAAFVYLVAQLVVLLYMPLVIGMYIFQKPQLSWVDYLFIAGSSALHLGYFLMLQRGYGAGDLSLIYPLARGTGPTLSTLAAILFFGERPTGLALAGGLLVIIGVFLLSGGTRFFQQGHLRQSLVFGLLTGVWIASYTLWDKYSVSTLLIPPLLLDYGSSLGRAILLGPYAFKHRFEVKKLWTEHWREVIGVALLSPLAYILVLTALQFTPVSYVAPAREISVLIGVAMGARLLREGDVTRRMAAAGLIVVGVMTLAFN